MSDSDNLDFDVPPIRVSAQRDTRPVDHAPDGICPKCARLSVCAPQHSLTDPVWYCDQFAIEPE